MSFICSKLLQHHSKDATSCHIHLCKPVAGQGKPRMKQLLQGVELTIPSVWAFWLYQQ